MLFVIRFQDNPANRHLRPQFMDAHLKFLKDQGDKVRVAGSMRHESDDRAIGGLWIVEVDDYAAVRALYEKDPFWTAGLRSSVEVCRYAKAFPDIAKPV